MSQNATSAPSRANRSACERPCPRAPPVISTTLPSNFPIAPPRAGGRTTFGSAGQRAPVDGQAVPGDVPGGVAEQPEQGAGDLARRDDLDEQLVVQPALVHVVGG